MNALNFLTLSSTSMASGQRQALTMAFPMFSYSTFTINEPEYSWFKPTTQRLDEICALPVGWDGYRAPPVRYDNARYAGEVLKAICGPNTPAPQIVPGSRGDLQLEWHTPNFDIEIHVVRALLVNVWYRSPETEPDGQELLLTSDLRPLAPIVKDMESDVAVAAAAT